MIIACPNCEARYRIDEARVDSAGARLRCARCRSLFRLPESSPPRAASASLASMLHPSSPPSPASSQRSAPESVASESCASETKVLLADPDPLRAAALVQRLAAQGLSVVSVADGVEAFLALQREAYPVAILRADLPRIQGEALCELIKGTENLKNTGVVVLRSGGADATLPTGSGAFDLELDEGDPEGRLSPFLESRGLRVKTQSESEMAPPAAFSRPSSPAISSPSISQTPLSGADAERAKAERLARIVVSDMLLYHPDRFDQVHDEEGLLAEFASEIREGELLLSKRVDGDVLSERDYLGEELRRAAQGRASA